MATLDGRVRLSCTHGEPEWTNLWGLVIKRYALLSGSVAGGP